MITKALIGVIGALALLCGWLWLQGTWLKADNAALSLEVASLERSVSVLTDAAAQSRAAAEVAKATAARETEIADRYRNLQSALEGNEDVVLPDWFNAWLDDLLGRVPG